jgi:SAM-dependent methyltransferase
MDTANKLPGGFDTPIAEPEISEQQLEWQRRNRNWWESNPMRYDWGIRIPAVEFTREFYEEIDRRHFSDAAVYTPPSQRPFDELIPYGDLANCDVLEIGVGNGSHAQLIAPHSRSYTGIDLTRYAVESTLRRFQIFGIRGNVRQMDAERMEFADASFDYIWTWGVIHHSANTEKILREMQRVLRPGGRAVIMVYHRSLLYYYVFNGVFRGIVRGGFVRTRSLHKLVQLNTDGAIARLYSIAEWRALTGKYFSIQEVLIKGQKSELLPLPPGWLKTKICSAMPNQASRFVLNSMRQGSFLISKVSRT